MKKTPRCHPISVLTALLAAVGVCDTGHAADVPTRGPVVNIVKWDGGDLPRVYERSEQLPLTREDILNLAGNGFSPEEVVAMVEERRFVGDASADALIALRRAGVNPRVIQAISRHALPPNRALDLVVLLEFDGASREARSRYLYIIIPDGPQERVFTADIGAVLSGKWQRDALVDETDPLLPRQVRRVTFASEIPLTSYGPKRVLAFTSTRPDIHTSADIPEPDRPGVRGHDIDYPASSLRRDCQVRIRYRQDAVLPYNWHMVDSHIQCEWN